MNVIWRTLLIMMRSRRGLRRHGVAPSRSVSRIRLTTLPTDVDLLGHMNNGRYLSLFDLGRWDLLTRTGVMDVMRTQRWYGVVARETITFRKSLDLWQRFTLESRFLGTDEKAIFMEHRAVVDGEIYARAVVSTRVLKRSGGSVSHDELIAALGDAEPLPELEPWIHEWASATRLPSGSRPAPSIWP